MTQTAKKAQGTSGDVAAAEKNGQIVKIESRIQVPPIQSRIQKIAELQRKSAQLYKLRENLQDLENFQLEGDKVFECVRLTDADGHEWKTANSFLLKKLVDVMKDEFTKKTVEIESEILTATI